MTDQPTPQVRVCGTMPVHERLLRTDPSYMAARAASETFAWEYQARRAVGRTGITVVPVVVHVVHRTSTENISDAQIQSQIDVLNRDFRATNPDRTSTPAAFSALIADARLEFELATTDPQGNPTTGITRTQTNVNGFSDDDAVKSSATGGADAWPAADYLNVWVCQLGGGLLGYAQFPGGSAATDGVVILHSAFGTTGTAAAPFDLGRTTGHEIGHWLNLRHIWGDDGNGCNGDDFVADTPNQAGSNSGMPAFPHVTCNNGPNGDLFMNYMDYTDDASMFMFTHGQVTRMHAALDGDRNTIGAVRPGPIVTLKFRDDMPSVKFADDPGTLKFRDDPGTLKFRDDPQTLKFRDDMPSLKFADDPGTLKFRDDVKLPFLEKPPMADITKMPGAEVTQPPVGPGPAPFVLATPHHSMAWTRSFPGAHQAAAASLGEQLMQCEQLLEEYVQADQQGQLTEQDVAAGNQLFEDYQELLRQYEELTGGQ